MLVQVEIREVIHTINMNVVVLRELDGEHRMLPIYIGPFEGNALEMALHQEAAPRPLTHDLVLNTIHSLNGILKRIIIDKLEKETFYAKLDVEIDTGDSHRSVWIDSRPSDALVIATKASLSVYIDEQVLQDSAAQTDDSEDPTED